MLLTDILPSGFPYCCYLLWLGNRPCLVVMQPNQGQLDVLGRCNERK